MNRDELLGRRLAAQGLTGPGYAGVPEAVAASLAVQSQDAPLARFSLGLRTGFDDAGVLAALATGEVVRTHVLRPTWHWVARDDLRWLLALTGPRVVSGMGARHRQLGITDAVRDAAYAALRELLADGPRTRKELAPALPATQFPQQGQVVGHLLLLAELDALICSGAPRDGEHTYALVGDVVSAADVRGREEAIDELVTRFVRGHGPTAERDLRRWCTLPVVPMRRVLADGRFERAEVDGVAVWFDPDGPDHGIEGAWLLPTFDEAYLSHDGPRVPRLAGHRSGDAHISGAEVGWGYVVADGVDLGMFKRTRSGGRLTITLQLAPGATRRQRARAAEAAERLAAFGEGPVAIDPDGELTPRRS